MSLNWKDSYEQLLNAMGTVSVFVMRQDTHEIVYRNNEAKKQEGDATRKRLYELWEKQCCQCAEENIKEKESITRTIFDDATKKIQRVTVTNIKWGEDNVPAFSIMIAPVLEGDTSAVQLNLLENIDIILSEGYIHSCFVNLSKNEYVSRLQNCYGRNAFFQGSSYDEMAESFYKWIHPMHEAKVRDIYGKKQLLEQFDNGKQRISHDYLLRNEDGMYRWVRGSVIFPQKMHRSDKVAVMLWKEIETEKGIAQQLLTEQEALFNSLPGYVLKIAVAEEIIFLEASKTFHDFFGEIGDNYQIGDHVFVEDKDFVISEIKKRGKRGQPISFECRVCDKTGKIVWIQCAGRIVGYQKGHPVYLLILLDIHNAKVTQMQLLKERERYRLAVVDMAVGIFEYYVRDDYFVYYRTRRWRK